MGHAQTYLEETAALAQAIEADAVERLAVALGAVRDAGGRSSAIRAWATVQRAGDGVQSSAARRPGKRTGPAGGRSVERVHFAPHSVEEIKAALEPRGQPIAVGEKPEGADHPRPLEGPEDDVIHVQRPIAA